MIRRHDIDWRQTFSEWSNYDLDDLERDIQAEKIRRAATIPRKHFGDIKP